MFRLISGKCKKMHQLSQYSFCAFIKLCNTKVKPQAIINLIKAILLSTKF